MQEAQIISKQETITIPDGCLAILLSVKDSNDDTSNIAVEMFHNFADATTMSKDERLLYAISQGILAMCLREPMKVVYKGIDVIRSIFADNDADFSEAGFDDFDVTKAQPKGNC